jgi:hypothetical protein
MENFEKKDKIYSKTIIFETICNAMIRLDV